MPINCDNTKDDKVIYDNAKKRKLVDKIHSLKDKEDLKSVRRIIKGNNPNIEFITNSNGSLLVFNNLSPKTYMFLDKFLHNIEKQKSHN